MSKELYIALFTYSSLLLPTFMLLSAMRLTEKSVIKGYSVIIFSFAFVAKSISSKKSVIS